MEFGEQCTGGHLARQETVPKPTAIDLKEHFLISRSKLRLGLVVAAGAVGAALIFVGCMPVLAQTSNRPGDGSFHRCDYRRSRLCPVWAWGGWPLLERHSLSS